MKLLGLVLLTLVFYQQLYADKYTMIKAEKTNHDFGDIKELDGPVSVSFTFKNVGKFPYTIREIKTSCGCTTTDYSKEAVKPGKSGYINVMYDPKNEKGRFNKMITVYGNSKNNLILTIEGNVIPRPQTILDQYSAISGNLRFVRNQVIFGEIDQYDIDTGIIKVYNPSGKTITIKHIKAPDHIRQSYMPRKIGPKETMEIEFYFSAYRKNDLGYVFDRIYLVTDDDILAEKEIIVVANITQDYSKKTEEELKNAAKIWITKTEHDFGDMKEGDVGTIQLEIKNEGLEKLIIYNIESSCGCAAYTLGNYKLNSGETTSLKVVFHSENRLGKQDKIIRFLTNDPNNKEIVIHIYANVIKPN